MHSTMPTVTCRRLSDVNVMCRVIYFHFPIQSAFFHVGQPGCTCNTQYPTSNIIRRRRRRRRRSLRAQAEASMPAS